MRLLKLMLKNFKGVKDLTIAAGGNNVSIFGDNAVGKTTIFDSFLWLLFGKDSQGKADFSLKTLDTNNQPIHNLDHEVEGVFEIGGRPLTLRKIYAEKWTRKRGSAQKTFEGHTTDHFIDGVPVAKKEFEAKISSIANEGHFKLLTSPSYFNEQLHWTDRRKILLEVCGDMTDEEVIASDKALAKLPDILNGRLLEDHRKVIAARRSEINKELEKLPVRIDEATRALPDLAGINQPSLVQMASIREAIEKKRQELARVEAGGEVAEKRKRLAEIDAEIIKVQNQAYLAADSKIDEKRQKLNGFKSDVAEIKADIAGYKKRMEFIAGEAARLETMRVSKYNAWHAVNNRQFEYSGETECPACGQSLPVERIAEAQEKALAAFNLTKATELSEIKDEGLSLKAKLEELNAENSELVNALNVAEDALNKGEAAIASLQQEIDTMTHGRQPAESPAIKKLQSEKDQLNTAITQLQTDNQVAVDKVRQEITDLEEGLETLEGMAQKVKTWTLGQERIKELQAQEKTLAAEFERLESELYLTEQFIRAKVNLLEQKINSKFKLARFKLFDVQVNGAVNECCETLYGGVPYSSGLNNAARINVGLDIINTLSEHYGLTVPVFIDNAEAVTQLIETCGQLITLVVSAKDKKLRVETENTMMEAV